jgi:hypothetical protein
MQYYINEILVCCLKKKLQNKFHVALQAVLKKMEQLIIYMQSLSEECYTLYTQTALDMSAMH